MKQTTEKIIAAAEERGYIDENEILLLKRRRNRGAERKNNPFTNPEEKALEWAKMHGARFTFNGFYGTGNNWYEPIYELITPICDIQYIVTPGQFQRA